MNPIKAIVRGILSSLKGLDKWSAEEAEKKQDTKDSKQKNKVKTDDDETGDETFESKELFDLWEFLKFKANSQAHHLTSVIGFDEWVEMEEIRRRIKEIYGIDYKNEKSLYPYIKTLTDTNLLENTNAGGRRKWRKKTIFINVTKKEQEIKEKEKQEKVKKKEKEKAKAIKET